MKKYKATLLLGLALIGLSVSLHVLHYAIFRDLHHIMIFLLADFAFIPLEVFFVSVVLDRIIERRDERQIRKKIYMLIGLFYQEIGSSLLNAFVEADQDAQTHMENANVTFKWREEQYSDLANHMKVHTFGVEPKSLDLQTLKKRLSLSKETIVSLITNPSIHEHASFSEVLMSTFHLADELNVRDLEQLTPDDYAHLEVDINRVYRYLITEWVIYMSHLQDDYPYLFIAALKSNPFDSVTI